MFEHETGKVERDTSGKIDLLSTQLLLHEDELINQRTNIKKTKMKKYT